MGINSNDDVKGLGDERVDPERGEFEVPGIHIPSFYKSPEEFLARIGVSDSTEIGSNMYFTKPDGLEVLVDLKRVNWEEVRRLRGEPEPTGPVAALRKHVKRISGAFGL